MFYRTFHCRVMQPHEELVANAMGCHLRQTAALDGLLTLRNADAPQ